MQQDPKIMGLCGETRVENKFQSPVTMIQVFEYHISHFLSKSFESLFGAVTCLPGCFSMYRIKTPKTDENGDEVWVPILANPDIVEDYSENIVDTLHRKNLLLLGEDRYLTTLMLKSFPKRKMMFVPTAICRTVVPDSWSVLFSQRRRWINSTIHNLLELVLVNDLCGIFCCSHQFLILLELIGTCVLPAAILFTIYLILYSVLITVQTIPLIMMCVAMGLPALLIIFTSYRWSYLMWMFIYIMALPVWNFALPLYAFWHFDDFSWGETRKVEGGEANHGEKVGIFDEKSLVMKSWVEWEIERRHKNTLAKLTSKSE